MGIAAKTTTGFQRSKRWRHGTWRTWRSCGTGERLPRGGYLLLNEELPVDVMLYGEDGMVLDTMKLTISTYEIRRTL